MPHQNPNGVASVVVAQDSENRIFDDTTSVWGFSILRMCRSVPMHLAQAVDDNPAAESRSNVEKH